MFVTFGIFAADQDVIAAFWPTVTGDIAVGHDRTQRLEIEAFRRRHVHHFLAQRAGLDRHVIKYARHAVDDRRARPGDIDHHRCVNFFAVSEAHAAQLAAVLQDFGYGNAEPEIGAVLARGRGQVLRRQCGVGDVASQRPEHRARERAAVGLAETVLVHAFRRPVTVE